ncbi:MAG: hypothetical protein ACK4G3_01820, partial [bacterium]
NEGMMFMMRMCHQMMERMMGSMEQMHGNGMGPMSPEEWEIAKLRADAEIKQAQIRRMVLEENINPDALKEKIKEVHALYAEIQFREILRAREKAMARKPAGKEGQKEDQHHHHMGGMGMMGR